MTNLNLQSRIIIAIASLSLIITYFVPVWAIYLFAPQYPEGLSMNIWLNKITGDVEIINGLNHYIGMKHINAEMFPEFKILGYIVAFYILFGLVVAWTGKMRWLFWYIIFTLFGGSFALVDFYKWGYEYGHNLDPNAAIKVPGLSYQPPVLGHKRLLNFDAYSYPDIGAWIVIVAAGIMFFIYLYPSIKPYLQFKKTQLSYIVAVLFLSNLFCTHTEPSPILSGKDDCYACKMGIVDLRYGAELISNKGKIFKFDDIGCLIYFLNDQNIQEDKCQRILVADYLNPKNWLDTKDALFVKANDIHSPMNFNYAAFSENSKINSLFENKEKQVISWMELKEIIINQK